MSSKILKVLSGICAFSAAAVLSAASLESPGYFVPVNPPGAEYVLDARIAVEGESALISGSGEITLANTSKRPISVLAFDWRVDPGRSFEISAGGRRLAITNEAMNLPPATPLFIELPEPLAPGRKISMSIRFTDRASIVDGGIQLQRWYPSLWWEGVHVREIFKVKLDTPAGWVTAVSGRLNPKTGRYENDCVTTQFGLVLSRTMKMARSESDGVLITALFTEKGEACARLCLGSAADIIAFYKQWIGAYPHKSLCIIPGGPQPWGGYPFASGIVVIHGEETFDPAKGEKEQTWWKWITAHEIGHQYWGEYVMPEDVRSHYTDSWLMIGLGINMDKEYLEARRLGWERHRAFIDTYLGGAKERDDTTMDAPPSLERLQKFDRNNVLIHGKGFAVQSALESILGPERYDAIYRRILRDFAGKRLSWTTFRGISEAETGEDLGWFFDSWVRSNKILCVRVAGQDTKPVDGGFLNDVRVEFDSDSILMPVPVEAVFEDGTRQRGWTGRFARTAIVRFESRSRLKSAEIDPDRRLALLQVPLPATVADLADAVDGLDWIGTGETALAIFKKPEAAGLKPAHAWFKLGMLLYDGRHYPESFESFKKCGELDPSDDNLFGVRVWMGIVKDLSGERDNAVTFYREALTHDKGRTMQHDQYGLRIGKAWVEERIKTPFQRDK
jgi:hypothetical protein